MIEASNGRANMGSAAEGFHQFNVVNWVILSTSLADPNLEGISQSRRTLTTSKMEIQR